VTLDDPSPEATRARRPFTSLALSDVRPNDGETADAHAAGRLIFRAGT
jgi:hypothetical protein